MAEYLTVSKKWNNPKIYIHVDTEGIELRMKVEDLKTALVSEIGSVTWIVKDKTFDKRVGEAIDRVISEIKKEAAKVVK